MSAATLLALLRRRYAPPALDADLLRAYAELRDEAAFHQLVERHGPLVLRLCRRLLDDEHAAEDAFQATFLILARRAGSVRRPEVLAAWLYGVARRVCGNARTARDRRRAAEAHARPRTAADPTDELSARELFGVLDDELHRLPERYRLPLWLCYWQGLTQEEAARRLGCSFGSVKGRLERGRAKLANRLTRRGLAPSALLAAPMATSAVPADLLARTAALAAAPWSKALPAAVLALAAVVESSKLIPTTALAVVLAGAAALALTAGLPQPPPNPPKADAPPPVAPAAPRVDANGDPLPPGALLRLGSSHWRRTTGHNDAPSRLTADGRAVIVGINRAVVWLDFDTGRELQRVECRSYLGSFTLGPDGNTLIMAEAHSFRDDPDGQPRRVEGTGGLRVWDLAAGREQRRIAEAANIFHQVVADRQYVAFADISIPLTVYDLATGREVFRYGGPNTPEGHCIPIGFVPGTGRLVVRCRQPNMLVRVLDIVTGQVLQSQTFPEFNTVLSPDGRWLWVRRDEAEVRLWDTTTGRERDPLTGHQAAVRAVAFTPDGRTLWSAGRDRTLRRWDLATGRELGRLTTHAGNAYHLDLSADGRRLIAVFGGEDVVRRYDLAAGRELPLADGHLNAVHGIAFAPDGKTLYSSATDNTVRAWDLATGRERRRWSANQPGDVNLVAVSPDGRRVVTGSSRDRTVRIWDAITGEAAGTIRAGEDLVAALTFLPDGRTLAVSFDGPGDTPGSGIRLWDVATGTEARRLTGPAVVGGSLAVTPDGQLLVGGGGDAPPRLFNLADGRLLRRFDGPDDRLALSPDGRMLAGAGPPRVNSRLLLLVERATGRERLRFGIYPYTPAPLAFSPDGRLLATPGDANINSVMSGDIVLWDVSTGREAHRFRGPGSVSTFAFAPDGRTLASTNFDSTITVWDMAAVRPNRAADVPAQDLPPLWDALASDDAAKAYQAVVALRNAEGRAVALLREKLRPAVPVPAERLARLVADLDAPTFAPRQQATAALTALVEQAEPALRRALADTPSLELRQRAEKLLAELDGPVTQPQRLQEVRAVEVLEAMATADARTLLTELATGDPAARLTREAKASLERLQRRR